MEDRTEKKSTRRWTLRRLSMDRNDAIYKKKMCDDVDVDTE